MSIQSHTAMHPNTTQNVALTHIVSLLYCIHKFKFIDHSSHSIIIMIVNEALNVTTFSQNFFSFRINLHFSCAVTMKHDLLKVVS